MELVQKIPDIINFIYWRSKPAVIHKDEIDMLKRLTSKYTVVSLLKSVVENNGLLRVLDGPSVYSNGNSIALRYDNVKVNLPSIGYTIVAERGETAEAAPAKGQTGFFGAFPKRISSLLFN